MGAAGMLGSQRKAKDRRSELDFGTFGWYKTLIRGCHKSLFLLVLKLWTDNPFLGTILPKPLISNAPIRPFDRRSDARPISERNEIHRRERNHRRGDDDICHAIEMPAPKLSDEVASAALARCWGCRARGGGYPAVLLGLPKTNNGAVEGWMVASLE
jgi:hypothetical protein